MEESTQVRDDEMSEDEASNTTVSLAAQSGDLILSGDLGTKDKYLFIAKDHPLEAIQAMQELRNEDKLCDITLIVQGVEIKAHKLVLAANSHYFRSMFTGDMLESRSSVVELKDVEPEAISLLVQYSYTSRLEITSTNVQSLMAAASIFNFPLILKATAGFLATHLHPSNCLGMRSFAMTYGGDTLVKEASEYFRNHFIDAVKSDEFLQLPGDVFADLLNSDNVNVRNEEDVYKALELWLKHDPEVRKDHLSLLLSHIRLPLLSLSFLKLHVESNPYIKRNLSCRDLIDEAKNYHLFPGDYSQTKGQQFHPRKSTVGMLFAIGGRGAIGEPFCSVECYNFRTNTWHEGPELRSRRRHVGVACLDGKLYAVGGHDGNQHLNTVERYDPKVSQYFNQPHVMMGKYPPSLQRNVMEYNHLITQTLHFHFVLSIDNWLDNQMYTL
jgi:hypothetical protein